MYLLCLTSERSFASFVNCCHDYPENGNFADLLNVTHQFLYIVNAHFLGNFLGVHSAHPCAKLTRQIENKLHSVLGKGNNVNIF